MNYQNKVMKQRENTAIYKKEIDNFKDKTIISYF